MRTKFYRTFVGKDQFSKIEALEEKVDHREKSFGPSFNVCVKCGTRGIMTVTWGPPHTKSWQSPSIICKNCGAAVSFKHGIKISKVIELWNNANPN